MAESPLSIPSDEELDKMSLEQLQALANKTAAPGKPGYVPFPVQPPSDVKTQGIAGAKEGAAGIVGTPAWLAKMGSAGTAGMLGALGPQTEEYIPGVEKVGELAKPYSTEAILQGKSKWPGVGGLALTPEQQQQPQNFWQHLARSGAANAVGMAPLAPFGPEAAMINALKTGARVGAGTLGGELGAKTMETLQTPEAAPWARAIGTAAGFGAPGGIPTASSFTAAGRQAQAARTAAADALREAKFPVSVAAERGSRFLATLEQQPSNRSAINEMVTTKLDPRQRSSATGNKLKDDMQAAAVAPHLTSAQTTAMNRQWDELNKLRDKKTGLINADDYYRFSRKWGRSPSPQMNTMSQILDHHMAEQSPVWKDNRGNISNFKDLGELQKAHKSVEFPKPWEGSTTGAIAAPFLAAGAHLTGHPGIATDALLAGLYSYAPTQRALMQAPGAVFRSQPGQAWMRGWPTNPLATYGALAAGPGQRLSQDVWNSMYQPQQVK